MSKLPSKRTATQWVTLFSNMELPSPTPAPLPQCYLCRQQRQCSETIMGDTCSPKGSKFICFSYNFGTHLGERKTYINNARK